MLAAGPSSLWTLFLGRQAKIGDLGTKVGINQNVLRFEIAMDGRLEGRPNAKTAILGRRLEG